MDSDNVFLKLPHVFKPLQALNAIVLAVCVGSTAGSENGIFWFVIIISMMISISATIIFALGLQDQLMDSLSNRQVQWNLVELIYSFVLAILSAVLVWLAFSFANKNLFGTSAGYIASGLFFILHTGLYAVPTILIYNSMQHPAIDDDGLDAIQVSPAHPYHDRPYQETQGSY